MKNNRKKAILLAVVVLCLSKCVQAGAADNDPAVPISEESLSAEMVKFESRGDISLPALYDPRPAQMVTRVKDQGDKPYCLTYARAAALESTLIRKGYENSTVDLSEMHMLYERWKISESSSSFGNWCRYSCVETYGSANSFENRFIYSDFPVYESQMPMTAITDGYVPDTAFAALSPYEVRTVYSYIPADSADLSEKILATKEAVYMYGGVAASLEYVPPAAGDGFYKFFGSGQDYSYHLSEDVDASGAGHAVEIIGWNDSYPKSGFSHMPEGDGAWLCKNSWGSFGSSSGFFWLSYYSRSGLMWEAFDVAMKGTTARSIEPVCSEMTLYPGQASDPVNVMILPETSAAFTEWYIDTGRNGDYLQVNDDNSITCKGFPKSTNAGVSTKTVYIRSKDEALGLSAPLKIKIMPNEIRYDKAVMIPDSDKTDIRTGVSTYPVAVRKTDIKYEKGSRVNMQDNCYAMAESYGEGYVKATVDGQTTRIPCFVYCTGFDLGDDIEYAGNGNDYIQIEPVFPLSRGTDVMADMIMYASSDESVAKVDNGMIHFTGNGTAQITATLKDEKCTNNETLTDTILVRVTGYHDNMMQMADIGYGSAATSYEQSEYDNRGESHLSGDGSTVVDNGTFDNTPQHSDVGLNSGESPAASVTGNHKSKAVKQKRNAKPSKVKIKSLKVKKNGTVILKFSRSSGAKQYEIEISADKSFNKVKTIYTRKQRVILKGIKSGSYIRVRGISTSQCGKWSKKKKCIYI